MKLKDSPKEKQFRKGSKIRQMQESEARARLKHSFSQSDFLNAFKNVRVVSFHKRGPSF
jgi:hypothetical protein